jgi:two-component system response regulator FixJ
MLQHASGAEGADLVVVVDDDHAASHSLACLLQAADLRTCEFASAEDLLAAGVPRQASCLVVDVRLGRGRDGIALVESLRRQGDRTPVVVVTGHGDIPLAVRAMRAGAADFVEKPFSADRILRAVREARLAGADAAKRAALVHSLTPREREVLAGLVGGKANKVVAAELDISVRTVEAYRASIMDKLQVRSFAAAVRIAIEAGIAD